LRIPQVTITLGISPHFSLLQPLMSNLYFFCSGKSRTTPSSRPTSSAAQYKRESSPSALPAAAIKQEQEHPSASERTEPTKLPPSQEMAGNRIFSKAIGDTLRPERPLSAAAVQSQEIKQDPEEKRVDEKHVEDTDKHNGRRRPRSKSRSYSPGGGGGGGGGDYDYKKDTKRHRKDSSYSDHSRSPPPRSPHVHRSGRDSVEEGEVREQGKEDRYHGGGGGGGRHRDERDRRRGSRSRSRDRRDRSRDRKDRSRRSHKDSRRDRRDRDRYGGGRSRDRDRDRSRDRHRSRSRDKYRSRSRSRDDRRRGGGAGKGGRALPDYRERDRLYEAERQKKGAERGGGGQRRRTPSRERHHGAAGAAAAGGEHTIGGGAAAGPVSVPSQEQLFQQQQQQQQHYPQHPPQHHSHQPHPYSYPPQHQQHHPMVNVYQQQHAYHPGHHQQHPQHPPYPQHPHLQQHMPPPPPPPPRGARNASGREQPRAAQQQPTGSLAPLVTSRFTELLMWANTAEKPPPPPDISKYISSLAAVHGIEWSPAPRLATDPKLLVERFYEKDGYFRLKESHVWAAQQAQQEKLLAALDGDIPDPFDEVIEKLGIPPPLLPPMSPSKNKKEAEPLRVAPPAMPLEARNPAEPPADPRKQFSVEYTAVKQWARRPLRLPAIKRKADSAAAGDAQGAADGKVKPAVSWSHSPSRDYGEAEVETVKDKAKPAPSQPPSAFGSRRPSSAALGVGASIDDVLNAPSAPVHGDNSPRSTDPTDDGLFGGIYAGGRRSSRPMELEEGYFMITLPSGTELEEQQYGTILQRVRKGEVPEGWPVYRESEHLWAPLRHSTKSIEEFQSTRIREAVVGTGNPSIWDVECDNTTNGKDSEEWFSAQEKDDEKTVATTAGGSVEKFFKTKGGLVVGGDELKEHMYENMEKLLAAPYEEADASARSALAEAVEKRKLRTKAAALTVSSYVAPAHIVSAVHGALLENTEHIKTVAKSVLQSALRTVIEQKQAAAAAAKIKPTIKSEATK
jgi:hypothetical protein